MAPTVACKRGEPFVCIAEKAFESEESDEERTWTLAMSKEVGVAGDTKVEQVDAEGEDGTGGDGMDITFLPLIVPDLSLRPMSL